MSDMSVSWLYICPNNAGLMRTGTISSIPCKGYTQDNIVKGKMYLFIVQL